MNVILNGNQSDTKRGDVTLLSSVDLTGKENLLLKVVNAAGVAEFALPTAITDTAIFVCMSGGAQGAETAAEAPDLDDQCRVLLDGACNPGDLLSLSSAKFGRLTKAAAGYGAGFTAWLAEEAGIDGQLVKVRRVCERAINL
ncbi:MAG: hypothetical protein KGL39_33505 [Patescibacteria group bacterium]|nr:hypothetical protein [Patescibacteria group bacterium]